MDKNYAFSPDEQEEYEAQQAKGEIHRLMGEITRGAEEIKKLSAMSNSEYLEYLKQERLDSTVQELTIRQQTGLPIKVAKEELSEHIFKDF